MFVFDMSMTWRESWYFLFGRKTCPSCSGRLILLIKTSDEGWGWNKEQDGLDFNVEYAHTTKAKVFYECRPCRIWYPIGQLAANPRP